MRWWASQYTDDPEAYGETVDLRQKVEQRTTQLARGGLVYLRQPDLRGEQRDGDGKHRIGEEHEPLDISTALYPSVFVISQSRNLPMLVPTPAHSL